MPDVHGEYEAFSHVLRGGLGSTRRRIDELFRDALTEGKRRNLATLVIYRERKLPPMLQTVSDEDVWYRKTLLRLLKICRSVISKYSWDHVQAALSEPFADIIEDLQTLLRAYRRGLIKEA